MTGVMPKGDGVVCAGNWIVDVVHTLDRWPAKSDLVHILSEAEGVGGGAANVAIDLAAFDTGLPLFAVGLTGTDRHAETVRQACRAAGLDSRHLGATAAAATAHTHVMNLPGDSRTFLYHAGANDLFDAMHLSVEALADMDARIFYLGYLNLLKSLDAVGPDGSTGAASLLRRAQLAGMQTCVDLVSADGPRFRATVEATLAEIDHLFLNEIEAARATGLAISGPQDAKGMEAAGRQLLAAGVRQTVILHSQDLAIWLPKAGPAVRLASIPVPTSEIVSPVGAGDAFCAGVIFGIHEYWPPNYALQLGHRAAAAALRSPTATGGIPPLVTLMPEAFATC